MDKERKSIITDGILWDYQKASVWLCLEIMVKM